MNFSSATILITGGNSGIGRALAEAMSARGARIVITGRNPTSLAQTLERNRATSGYLLDVSQAAEIRQFAATIVENHPSLNVLVNNAGTMEVEDLLADEPTWDVIERTLATNLLGPMRLTTALLPHLRAQRGGAIVNVTSTLAFVPRAATPTYGASKAALHSWTQSLRHQLRATALSVVEIAPPLVATDFAPGQADNPQAMPLNAFVAEAISLLSAEVTPDEVIVERAKLQCEAERRGRFEEVFDRINPI